MTCPECGAAVAQGQTEAEHAYEMLEVAEAKLEYVLAENARMREVLLEEGVYSDDRRRHGDDDERVTG